jgi:hypothetical protein
MKEWVKVDRTLVMLKANQEKCQRIVEKALRDGVKVVFFFDEYYPEEFGWTSAAFYPMTKEEGHRYFSNLKLA